MLQAVYLVLCCACLLTLTLASVAWCPNRCNGNGVCSKKGSCECFPGFNGVDCSQRICPSDIAWVDFPRRNNTAHAPFTECSNMGTCDRTTGLCKCRTGFSGAACERMDCPMGQTPYSKANFLYEAKTCSGNGRCVSLRELSTYEDYSQYFDNSEYTAWDADKIYGCLCDDGWEGPRCDQRSCPKGIDPLTDTQTLAPFEIQYLECKCDNCDGGIYLVLNNEVTPVIAYDATAPVVAEELEAFPSIDRVETRLIQGDAICSSTGSVLEIKFILPRGAQNRLKVLRAQGLTGRSIAIRAKGEEVKSMYRGPQSVGSSVVLATCSNRGTCDYDTGSCVCQAGYESSDGLGNIGTLGDCGYLASSSKMYTYTIDGDSYSTYSTCPIDSSGNTCSGHGTCDSSYGRCSCDDGYQGYDCSERTCASDYAWFGLVGQDHKSLIAECSAAGICNRATGVCDCVHNAYGGTACERLTCAKDTATGLICGGQGVCLPMWHLALYAYSPAKELANIYYDTPWDAAKIYGCLCERAISVDGQFDSTYQSLGPFTIQRSYFNRTIGSNDSTSNIAVSNTALLNVDDFARFHRGPYAKTSTDFIGYVCTEKRCPTGDVPTLYNHASEHLLHLNEIQEMICRANNGTFQLTFRENTTLPISFNATASELEYRLEQIFTIGDVSVTISGEKFSDYGNVSTVCSADRNTTVLIEFLTEHGDVPMLQADVSYLDMNGEHIFDTIYTGNFLLNITEYQKGTTQDVECSGLGICDYSVGQCKCMPGFSSSNGSVYAPGEYGDCSYFNPLYTTEALVHPNRGNKIRRGLDTQA